ncbi:hypothetical protein DIPPA_14801 [Diplonema papillatum]|nr:hypothetical protein DIPPA_14801 [Diplonema papillatum]
MAMQDFLQRIFPASTMTPGMSKDDFRKVFDQRLWDFEGGFLQQTHLPGIVDRKVLNLRRSLSLGDDANLSNSTHPNSKQLKNAFTQATD